MVAAVPALTPVVKLLLMAKSAELFDPMNTPPCAMNSRNAMSPSRPMPMRVSSVCAQVPMFGSSFLFHGVGFRHIGDPSTAPWPPPGPKMITSYFARRLGVFFTVSGSM